MSVAGSGPSEDCVTLVLLSEAGKWPFTFQTLVPDQRLWSRDPWRESKLQVAETTSSGDTDIMGKNFIGPKTSLLVYSSTPGETLPDHFTFSGTATAPTISLSLPTMTGAESKLGVPWALVIIAISFGIVLPFLGYRET